MEKFDEKHLQTVNGTLTGNTELSNHVSDMQNYDVVYIGFPNWWYDMPMAVYSFLEEYNFSGKIVIPFCTHGGSKFSDTIESIRKELPNSTVLDSFEVYGEDAANVQNDVNSWLKKIGMVQ